MEGINWRNKDDDEEEEEEEEEKELKEEKEKKKESISHKGKRWRKEMEKHM